MPVEPKNINAALEGDATEDNAALEGSATEGNAALEGSATGTPVFFGETRWGHVCARRTHGVRAAFCAGCLLLVSRRAEAPPTVANGTKNRLWEAPQCADRLPGKERNGLALVSGCFPRGNAPASG